MSKGPPTHRHAESNFLSVDHPDPAKSKFGSGSLRDTGGVNDATIVRHLAPLREARVWLPAKAPAGATDLRIHRVMASGGAGATVEFTQQGGP